MSRSEQKEQTRQRILQAAGRGFRSGGFGGIGVDGLAKEAGVTSGAFYAHFPSKAAAFRSAVVRGVGELRDAVRRFQVEQGAAWWPGFVRFYLGPRRTCALAESCALQSLASDVARADDASRRAFEVELRAVAAALAEGPTSPGAPADAESALHALATLVGAVTLARAVGDRALSDRIAESAERALLGSLPGAGAPASGKSRRARG